MATRIPPPPRFVRAVVVVGLVVAVLAGAQVPVAPAAADAEDQHRSAQWGLDQVRAEDAWALSRGAGQTIAIVDSGIDLAHPDLQGKIAGGATFVGCSSDPDGCGSGGWRDGEHPDEASGHGTHVAGIAAAVTGNGIGVAGVAPEARVLAVKAIDGNLGGTTAEVAAGIRWATRNGADVINLSLAFPQGTQGLTITGLIRDVTEAVREAVATGVVVVAAAGNDFAGVCSEPAFDPRVLCVVATDRFEQRASYSNLAVDRSMNVLAAPGGLFAVCNEDIIGPWPTIEAGRCSEPAGTPGYAFEAGTSMAAPHVSGVAALLLAQGRSADEVVSVLRSTARTPVFGVRGLYTPTYGFGIVDAAAAVRAPRSEVVERVAGADRVATAAAVSRRVFSRARTVVLARADDYADALAGAPLAAQLDAPLLLSARSSLSSVTASEIQRLGASRAVLLGGEAALSRQVGRDLEARDVEVRRIAGGNRFDTAARITGELPSAGEAFVTEGANADPSRGWPDALSASGLAAAQQRPILLVTRDRLPPETAAALRRDQDVTVVGGRGAVSDAVVADVDERSRTVRRIAGSTRYETSARVAEEAEARGVRAATTWIATGRAFADGLVAGAAAGAGGGVLLLVDGHDLDGSPPSRAFLEERRAAISSARLVGGAGAISARAEEQIRRAVGG